jgi:predicted amidophosphoribosyltransferase
MNVSCPAAAVALDDSARIDHPYLTATDRCWYLAEYISGPGYKAGHINQLISNLKCAPSVVAGNLLRRRYKLRAIGAAAAAVRSAVSRSWAESATWVPIPPSYAVGHADQDDRLTQVLGIAFAAYNTDVRDLLYSAHSHLADHSRARRIDIESLYAGIMVDWAALGSGPLREHLVLFDDVLTTGKHYKCCERRLRDACPGASIGGLFVARRVLSGHGRRPP